MYCLIHAQARGIFWFKYLNYIIIIIFFFFFGGGGGGVRNILWIFFFMGKVTTKLDRMRIFLRGKNFKYFLGCLIFPIFLLRQTVDAGPNPTYEEKVRVPPTPTHTHTHTHPGSQSMMRSC